MKRFKFIFSYLFMLFFIGLAIWFIKNEGAELREVKPLIVTASWRWLALGLALNMVYVLAHGMMYRAAFAAVSSNISIGTAMLLFLKRNFISVFLPAGGVSSLAFFGADIKKKGVESSQINYASSIYGFVGILSVIVIAIPVFIYGILKGTIGYGEWFGLLLVVLLLFAFYLFFKSILAKGAIYRNLTKRLPATATLTNALVNNKIIRKHFMATLYYSIWVEVIGIVYIYIAMLALHLEPSWMIAIVSYIVGVVFLIISPLLRGLGPVETSMTFILIRLGYSGAEAISITLVYRFMDFWIPLALGMLSFLLKINTLLMRILPPVLLFILGLVNVVSVLTPAKIERLTFLKNFLPIEAINGSNYFVLFAGLFLLATASFMLRGLKMAWYFAMTLCMLSLIGHLTKAIDYEEAAFSLFVILILIASRKQYYIRHNSRLRTIGIQTTLLTIIAVFIYGCFGFYFLDQRHFNINFNWKQAIIYTFDNFFLIGNSDLHPKNDFARDFLYSLNVSGFLSLTFLTYTLIRPYFFKSTTTAEEFEQAKLLVKKYGNSSLDYFKTYQDKSIYINKEIEGFISYRVAGDFAFVLEGPVAAAVDKTPLIKSFDKYCYESGFKSLYYRTAEENLEYFLVISKKMLFLGQEGIVDLTNFSLEGGKKKSIRNAIRKIKDLNFTSKIYTPPIDDGLLEKLQPVSNEWLKNTRRKELVFSQGMFIWEELKQQTIITVENPEGKVIAFLNLIPDYAKDEGTYDLIRKTSDAPNGVIDFIMISLFNHFKEQGYKSVNIGFSPLAGLTTPTNFPEKSIKFAYEKIRSFSHYKGMREAKEKFSPVWHNKYLIYDQDYDLLKIPAALIKVFKP